tara:strand:- start:2985 stop:4262 length:1278 start_codon:yes stop_codon:yes gene_type:complete
MASKFGGFLDNLANGALSPKGNLADWQHASRLYVNDTQKHAPKVGFSYHVTFYLTEQAKAVIPDLVNYTNVIGMLVKGVDLPKFTAQVETKNKYNRKKHVQSKLDYSPVNIDFHDDNFGATTALMEAYYKYYFADGSHNLSNGAYGNRRTGDTTYEGAGSNAFKFGMNNNTPSIPFFDRIEIAQMARKSYTKFTLVNPLISSWSHDKLDNTGNNTLTNSMTVEYDAVFYDRGHVEAGDNGNPAGFGNTAQYDVTPSPITLQGGGTLGIDGLFGAGVDLYEYITQGKNFNNPIAAGLAAANLIGNIRNLSSEGLREGGMRILTGAIGDAAGIDVSGVAGTFFPKNGGTGGAKDVLIATAAIAGLSAVTSAVKVSTTTGDTNPANIADTQFQGFQKSYQNSGGTGGINAARAVFDSLPDSEKTKYGG